MRTVATIVYDTVNPFELAVATEVFGFERPEIGIRVVSWLDREAWFLGRIPTISASCPARANIRLLPAPTRSGG